MSGEGASFVLEFKGKYLFDQHSFYKMSAKVLDSSSLTPDFGGTEIQIFPRAIPLAEIESRAGELYEYVERLRKVTGAKNPGFVTVNLATKKLIVDGAEYDIDVK